MKRGLLAAAMALTTAIGSAQTDQVTFQKVLDIEQPVGSAVHTGTYVPVADKFLIGEATSINVFNGVTGAPEADLNITGISPSSNGFFALVPTDQGHLYAYENGGDDIWRWSSLTDTPTKVIDEVPGFIERFGDTATVNGEIVLATTGSADDGIVNFFSDSFPFSSTSFSFNESVDLDGKSGLALNNDATVLYTVGSTGGIRNISKWVKTAGEWNPDPVWPTPAIPATGHPNYSGPMAYDDVNDILFVLDMRGDSGGTVNRTIKALDGTTAELIGEVLPENLSGTLGGYAGAYVAPTNDAGTIWIAARAGSSNSNAVLYKYTYEVSTSSVDDWSLYEQ